MKRILIPTDFSPASRRALEFAVSIFENSGICAKIFLVNTFPCPSVSVLPWVEIHDKWKKSSAHWFEEALDFAGRTEPLKNVSFETLSFIGSLENVLAHVVREQNIDGVVMGMSQELKNREEVGRILNRLPCPVLLVPTGNEETVLPGKDLPSSFASSPAPPA